MGNKKKMFFSLILYIFIFLFTLIVFMFININLDSPIVNKLNINKFNYWHVKYLYFSQNLIVNANKNPYVDFSNYNSDKFDIYNEFQKNHPERSTYDVIWMVNAGLNFPFYTDVKLVENPDSVQIINKYNRLDHDFIPSNLVTVDGDHLLKENVYDAFVLMSNDLVSNGYKKLIIVSSYRSFQYQNQLYNEYLNQDPVDVVDSYSAKPGFSEHQSGRALDVTIKNIQMESFGSTSESNWINDNSYKYGFIVRYKDNQQEITGYEYEPWHLTFVGIDIATTMHNENIQTLEEYMYR